MKNFIIKGCVQCGKKYATHLETRRFCGVKCRMRHYRKRLREKEITSIPKNSVTEIDNSKQSAVLEKATCVYGWQGTKMKPPITPKAAWDAANRHFVCWCDKCWHYYRVVGARRKRDFCELYEDAHILGDRRVELSHTFAKELHRNGFDCSYFYSDLLPHCENKALAETPFVPYRLWVDEADAK